MDQAIVEIRDLHRMCQVYWAAGGGQLREAGEDGAVDGFWKNLLAFFAILRRRGRGTEWTGHGGWRHGW